MSTDLGFTGAGGVGRSFTIQDLFAAVAPQTSNTTASNQATTLNDSAQPEEDIACTDVLVLAQLTPAARAYNATVWQNGVWS